MGALGGGLGGSFVGACATARQAVKSGLINDQQANDLLASLAAQLGVKLDAEKTSSDDRARMNEAIQKCLQEPGPVI